MTSQITTKRTPRCRINTSKDIKAPSRHHKQISFQQQSCCRQEHSLHSLCEVMCLPQSQHDPCLRSAPHKAPGEQHPAHSQGGTPHWIPCLAATPTLKYQHSDVLVTKQRHGCRPQSCKCNGYCICFERTAPEQTHTACMSCTALHEAAHVVLTHTWPG